MVGWMVLTGDSEEQLEYHSVTAIQILDSEETIRVTDVPTIFQLNILITQYPKEERKARPRSRGSNEAHVTVKTTRFPATRRQQKHTSLQGYPSADPPTRDEDPVKETEDGRP